MKKPLPFKPLSKTRLYEEVADQIKQAIYDGQLKPGDRLPSERDLCVMFNVGRPTVREALRTLSVMGLVEVNRGAKGAFVAEADISQYMEAVREELSWLIRADKKTLEEIWEVRKYIELGIVFTAAKTADTKNITTLENLIAKMEACGNDFQSYFSIAVEFHRELARITKNKVYFLFWEMIHSVVLKGYLPILRDAHPEGPQKLTQVNKLIVDALKSKDPDIINKAMARHSKMEYFSDL
ncbi:MAG: FadR family transcriptional regulator [Desulfobacteraceae bacterium]|nr:FadR family transcriptional regulator [Desulfobacteraceae bacterium]